MILINSVGNEPSTNDVIDWLCSENSETAFVRLNSEDVILNLKIENNGDKVCTSFVAKTKCGNKIISLNKIVSYWYRRGLINFLHAETSVKSKTEWDVQTYLDKEWHRVSEFISNRLLEKKKKIGNINDNQLNKLEVLIKASRLGIAIPKTIVSTYSVKSEGNMITKCLYNGGFTIEEKYSVGSFTNRIKENDIETFFPSLFQEEVEKIYELRVFYFLGEFYSSVIFSQGNSKTEVDFRNYDRDKPNRVVPYKIPCDLELKLKNLMDELKLETGSIDLIVTPEKKYVFLEVNPIGQFNQVSIPCNYFLEKKIADYLLYEN